MLLSGALSLPATVVASIYVGGWRFSKYNGEAHLSIACLESTGLVCVNFDSGTGFTRQTIVYVIVLIKDGSGEIYAGAMFDNIMVLTLAVCPIGFVGSIEMSFHSVFVKVLV